MVFSITCSILRGNSAEQKSIKQIRGPCGLGQFPPLEKTHPWVFEASQHKDIKRYISVACWSTLGSSGFGGGAWCGPCHIMRPWQLPMWLNHFSGTCRILRRMAAWLGSFELFRGVRRVQGVVDFGVLRFFKNGFKYH